jgi:hypothetical protein
MRKWGDFDTVLLDDDDEAEEEDEADDDNYLSDDADPLHPDNYGKTPERRRRVPFRIDADYYDPREAQEQEEQEQPPVTRTRLFKRALRVPASYAKDAPSELFLVVEVVEKAGGGWDMLCYDGGKGSSSCIELQQSALLHMCRFHVPSQRALRVGVPVTEPETGAQAKEAVEDTPELKALRCRLAQRLASSLRHDDAGVVFIKPAVVCTYYKRDMNEADKLLAAEDLQRQVDLEKEERATRRQDMVAQRGKRERILYSHGFILNGHKVLLTISETIEYPEVWVFYATLADLAQEVELCVLREQLGAVFDIDGDQPFATLDEAARVHAVLPRLRLVATERSYSAYHLQLLDENGNL